MEDRKKIASISISGEITLNMHSLNNEGGEGNQIITRQVTIVDKNGVPETVNAISGDMFKHIHVQHLTNLSKEQNVNLCTNCKIGNPNRLSSGEELGEHFKENNNYKDYEVIDALITKCIIDDTHGVLVTKIGTSNKNVPRKSTVEFGWTVGIPGKNNTESYLHTKLVADSAGVRGEGSNEGQNIFHRPANHGVYAFVCSIDAYRIGLNDITRKYSIEEEARTKRFQLLLRSLLSSFVNPQGAMTSTQKPHITDFKGVVSVSEKLIPAPTISALNNDYISEIKTISDNINKIEGGAITNKTFNGLGELSEIFVELNKCKPYKIE